MTKQQTFIIDNLLADLLGIIMEDKKMDIQDALDLLYNSQIYAKINDIETGLYLQSADYNYEFLSEECNKQI